MTSIPLNLIIVLLFFVGIVWLQVSISKKKNQIWGLILPLISFLYSLIMVFNIAVFKSMFDGEIAGFIILILLLANIPTTILMAIYVISRQKIKTNKKIEKVNIRDLE